MRVHACLCVRVRVRACLCVCVRVRGRGEESVTGTGTESRRQQRQGDRGARACVYVCALVRARACGPMLRACRVARAVRCRHGLVPAPRQTRATRRTLQRTLRLLLLAADTFNADTFNAQADAPYSAPYAPYACCGYVQCAGRRARAAEPAAWLGSARPGRPRAAAVGRRTPHVAEPACTDGTAPHLRCVAIEPFG